VSPAPASALPVAAPDPRAWLDGWLAPRLGIAPPLRPDDAWPGLAGLDRARLADLHARLAADGATGPAAAKWLAGWYAGGLAAAVGRTLGLARAALVVDPADVRWHVRPEGWPDGYDLGAPAVAVAAGHPWAEHPGVRVVADADAVRELALDSVLGVATPLVTRLRTLAKVGLPSLWAEVGDRLGLAVTSDLALPVDETVAAELRAVVALPRAPWKARPRLEVGPTAAGPAYLGQKGGCCLAYLCQEEAGEPDPAQAAWLAVYRERFPVGPGRPDYCSTCSLLEAGECAARQRLWVEHHSAGRG